MLRGIVLLVAALAAVVALVGLADGDARQASARLPEDAGAAPEAARFAGPGPIGALAAPAPSELGGLKGDMDCNGTVDAVDALRILRYTAGLNPNLPGTCPPIGGAATPAPGQTPTPTPTSTPAPTATPSGTIAHCWIAVMGYAFLYPGILGGSATCQTEIETNPPYDCTIYVNIASVGCSSSLSPWPTYFCDYYSLINDAYCETSASYFPDYDCSVYPSLSKVNCYVDVLSPVDGPDYQCSVVFNSVNCQTDSGVYADFTCTRSGSTFTCR